MATATGSHAASKQPATPLAGPYGHPFHPILVTVPIGAWLASLVFDVAALMGADTAVFTRGALWLVGIGIIGAVAAAVFGLIDLSKIAAGTPARRTGLTHMVINLGVVVLFMIGFAVRLGAGYDSAGYDSVSIAGFIISLVALAALMVSGWLGGKLVFHYGVRVADETTQAEGFHDAR